MITLKEYEECVKSAMNCIGGDGTAWHVMGTLKDGRELCLVFGYEAGYDEDKSLEQIIQDGKVYTLCSKLAVNIDDLQADYDFDWYMPFATDGSGEVFDTDMAVCKPYSVDWYNEQAKEIINMFDEGKLEV